MEKRIQSPGLSVAFSDEEVQAARKKNELLSMDIELTKRCNMSCIYCYSSSGKRAENELELAEVINIIDQGKEMGLRTVSLSGGEPLLDERYFTLAEYTMKHRISVMLFTNGTLVTKELANKLFELKVSPCIKLDSLSLRTQDYLAGREGALERIKDSLNNLISAGYTREHPLAVNAVICSQNLAEIPDLWEWTRKQRITPFLTRLQPMGRAQRRTDLTVTSKELYSLFCRISEIDKQFGIVWEPKIPWVYGKACRRHYVGCFIDVHGNVQPCSGVPIKAGNIRERGLAEILSSSKIFKVARNMESYIEGACRSCKYKSECYGCRSIALLHERGSFTAADPLCWHNQRSLSKKRWNGGRT